MLYKGWSLRSTAYKGLAEHEERQVPIEKELLKPLETCSLAVCICTFNPVPSFNIKETRSLKSSEEILDTSRQPAHCRVDTCSFGET